MNLTQIMALISQWSNDNGIAWNGTTVYGDSDSQPYHNPGIVDYLNGSLESGGVYVDNGDGNAPVMVDYSPLVRFLLNHGVIPLGVNGSILGNLTLATQVKGMNPQQVLQYVTNAPGNIYIDSATGQAFWSNITGAPIPLATNVNYGYAVPSVTFTIPPNNSSFLKTLYTVVSGYFLDTGGAGLITFAPWIAAGVSSAIQAISPTIAPVVDGTVDAVLNPVVADNIVASNTVLNTVTDSVVVDAPATVGETAATTVNVIQNTTVDTLDQLRQIASAADNAVSSVSQAAGSVTDTPFDVGQNLVNNPAVFDDAFPPPGADLTKIADALSPAATKALTTVAAAAATAALQAITRSAIKSGVTPPGYQYNPNTGLLQPVTGQSSIFSTGSNMPLILGIGLFAILAMKGK